MAPHNISLIPRLITIALLAWITKLGSQQGNFQYIKSASEIDRVMENTLQVMELSSCVLSVQLGKEGDADAAVKTIALDKGGRANIHLKGQETKRVEGPLVVWWE